MTAEIETQAPVAMAKKNIAEMRRLRDALAARVGGLSDADLTRQSACADWDVSQVLSHLGSGAELGLGWLEAARRGEDPPGREANQPVWDRWNAMSPRERADAWLAWSERSQSAFDALDDDALATLQVNLSFFPQPLDAAGFSGMRLSEQALHTWDIDVAFDDDARIAESSAELLLGRLPQLVSRTAKADRWQGDVGEIDAVTTEPAHHWQMVIRESVALEEAPNKPASATLRLPGETFLRLVSGRFRDTDTARVAIDGAARLDDVRGLFPGF